MSLRYDSDANSREELIPFTPATATNVLDVGCGTGRLGQLLRNKYPSATMWGVEPDEEHRRVAERAFDHLFSGFFPDDLSDLPAARFELIVFADVLEHMVEPELALIAARRLLAPGGQIVASIPNIRHHSVLRQLVLHGQWNYTPTGILDKTHLRFYTRRSLEPLFATAGLHVDCIEGINLGRKGRLADKLSLKLLDDMLYSQYAVVASTGE